MVWPAARSAGRRCLKPPNRIMPIPLPEAIETEAQLEDVLTRPSPELSGFIRQARSPLLILGAGGKMGPTLALLARRAADTAGHALRIVAVSRFTDESLRGKLESRGIETIACDLLEREAVAALPEAPDVLNLVGRKFGSGRNPALTWAVNTIVPSHVAARFPRARIVALSTGNVYPLTPVDRGGAPETHPLTPLGEYANAAVARERLVEYHSGRNRTPVVLLRLTYAVELRYGVLHDLARKVWANEPVDVTNGWFNCIWQGDANERILRALSLAACPPLALNLTAPGALSVRKVAARLGELMGRTPQFTGTEALDALLTDPAEACARLGPPATPLDTLLRWTARWVASGGVSWNKPTRFEVRNGVF